MIASTIPLAQQVHPFDARGIARRFRHAAIFGALDALQPGETMRFVNDHDPLPLLAQLLQRYGDNLAIQYVQREPGAIANVSPPRVVNSRWPVRVITYCRRGATCQSSARPAAVSSKRMPEARSQPSSDRSSSRTCD